MILISFALQVVAIGMTHQFRPRAQDDHFGFGWEMGRIGRSLAMGQGFSNPYGDSTGPTAWEPPLYPLLTGGVFRIFGVYTAASAWVLLTINSFLNALTCIPVFLIARKFLGEKLALWSAWIWALLPYEMYWAVHWVFDTTFSPFFLSLIIWLSLELAERGGWKKWAWFGALWGMLALSNPSTLSFLPFSGLWVWHQRHKRGLPSFKPAVLAAAIFFLCITPWLVRNHHVFGRWVFIRDDFGMQLRLGNGPYADGMWRAYLQPNLNVEEFAAFRRLGELAYAERCRQLAFAWIRQNPARFALNSLKRFFYFWGGVPKDTNSLAWMDWRNSLFLASSVLALWGLGRAIRKKKPGAGLFLWLVLSYPAIYYFVYPHARYRHPIEPELLILGVYLISEASSRPKNSPLDNGPPQRPQ